MTIEERVQKKDKELLELYKESLINRSMGDVKGSLKKLWESIRTNEEILSIALKLSNTTDADLINFTAPSIAGLILIDYKNVDPLAYDVVTRYVFDNELLGCRINPLLSEYNISYLMSILFNHDFKFDYEYKKYILSKLTRQRVISNNALIATYYAYTHPNFTIDDFKNYDLYTRNLNNLLQNYEERAKLRRLTKLPYEW